MNTVDQTRAGLSRRDFIRLGLVGGAVITTGAATATLSGCSRVQTPAHGFNHLRPQDIALLTPLVPALLAGALPADDVHTVSLRALKEMDTLFDGAEAGSLELIKQLYDALQIAPMRWYLTGYWRAFDRLTPEQRMHAVDNWSKHSRAFGRLALRGVCQPLLMAWYLTPEGAASSGYPGSPKLVIN